MNGSFFHKPPAGFIFTSGAGVMLHFLYEKSGNNILFAAISGVNESTWEHMKLLFFPLFVYSLIQSHFYEQHRNFWCVKFAGTVTGITLIPVLFYTYNGAFGKSPDWLNISIFFISAAAVFFLENRLFAKDDFGSGKNELAFYALSIICATFILFTFIPPELPLFREPLTGRYGIW